jgi:ABC-2 type transport system permease protein
MSKYLYNLGLVLRRSTAYRGDFFTGLLGLLLRITIYYYLWSMAGSAALGMSVNQLVTYSVLAILLAVVMDNTISVKLGRAIMDGSIGIQLLRPVDLQLTHLVTGVSESLYQLGTQFLPVFACCILLFPVQAPASALCALFFLISVLCGMLIGATFSYLVGGLTFWTYNDWGLTVFRRLFIQMFSGAIVPLMLLPDWVHGAFAFLPFQAMIHQPIQIYLGQFSPLQALQVILFQLAWSGGLCLLGRWVTGRALNQLVIQGG